MALPMVGVNEGRRIYVALNAEGRRIGETHHNASIPDAVVDHIRERREECGLTYQQLSEEFGLRSETVRKICLYLRRDQTPAEFRRLENLPPQASTTEKVRKWRRMKQMQQDIKAEVHHA